MQYIKKLQQEPSFLQNGLHGYNYILNTEDISITIEDCFKGHDKYHTNIHSNKIYYVVEGKGKFKIGEETFEVKKDDLIEIPKNTEFVFAGKMKLLLIMLPAFRPQDGIDGKENDLY